MKNISHTTLYHYILKTPVIANIPPLQKYELTGDIEKYLRTLSDSEIDLMLTQDDYIIFVSVMKSIKCVKLNNFISILKDKVDLDITDEGISKEVFINTCLDYLQQNYNTYVDDMYYFKSPLETSDAEKLIYVLHQYKLLNFVRNDTDIILQDKENVITVQSNDSQILSIDISIKKDLPTVTIHNNISNVEVDSIISLSKYQNLQNGIPIRLQGETHEVKWSAHLDPGTKLKESKLNDKLKEILTQIDKEEDENFYQDTKESIIYEKPEVNKLSNPFKPMDALTASV